MGERIDQEYTSTLDESATLRAQLRAARDERNVAYNELTRLRATVERVEALRDEVKQHAAACDARVVGVVADLITKALEGPDAD